jgi:transcriptional regulator with GAF, ATPase, and Fis domain
MFGAFSGAYQWPEAAIEHLQTVGALVWNALLGSRRDSAIGDAASKIAQMPIRTRLAPPVRSTVSPSLDFNEIIGESAALHAALNSLEEVIETDSSVLLLGETGTGKELFARALHLRGPRRAFPLVSVNCAALPATLIESELFGHQRGAFTGAIAPRQGRFELAHKGTLFLDEIGDLPLELQAKLLRVLQEGSFERVGSSHPQAVDVRIIGATHRDLAEGVSEGRFRADLYYRLNVFPIRLPPLRDRREDIPALAWSIIRRRQQVLRRHIETVTDETMTILQQHSWPGNVREPRERHRARVDPFDGRHAPVARSQPRADRAQHAWGLARVRGTVAHRRRASRMRMADQRIRQRGGTPRPSSEHAPLPHEEAGHPSARAHARVAAHASAARPRRLTRSHLQRVVATH